MSVEMLRKAAAVMREQNSAGRGYMDDTFLAVADYLDHEARFWDGSEKQGVRVPLPRKRNAEKVARAYLAEATP